MLSLALKKEGLQWNREKDIKEIEDIAEEIKLLPNHPLNQKEYELKTLLIAPIKRKDELYGFLMLWNKLNNQNFTREDLEILNSIASGSAVALENSLLFETLKTAQQRQTELLHELINAEERERNQIVGELHDRTGVFTCQFLHILNRCESILKETSCDVLQQEIGKIRTLVNNYNKTMKKFFWEISPSILTDIGLISALKQYLCEIQEEGEFTVSLSLDSISMSLSPEIDLILYRIVQEAILNIRKHAKATNIYLELETDGKKGILKIRDNGVGFCLKEIFHGGVGFRYIEERIKYIKGSLEINSSKGEGTEIAIIFPLPSEIIRENENNKNINC